VRARFGCRIRLRFSIRARANTQSRSMSWTGFRARVHLRFKATARSNTRAKLKVRNNGRELLGVGLGSGLWLV
jgi:hypothetical protein